LNLSDDILNNLPNDTRRVFDSKRWTMKDEIVQHLLYKLASDHYDNCHVPADLLAALQASGQWK
jgi:hypothetical protein